MDNFEFKQYFLKLSALVSHHYIAINFLFTALIFVGFFATRRLLLANLPSDLTLENRRKKVVGIRNGLGGLAAFLLFFVWGTELKTLTVSLVAIAAAVVLATKEVIMSLIGGIIRTTTKKYQVGDRIEIKDYCGDVIDVSLLGTTLMEINTTPGVQIYTGRTIYFPHSYLLTEALKVNHISSRYMVHLFSVPVEKAADVLKAKNTLQLLVNELCKPFLEDALLHMNQMQEFTSIDMPSPAPKIIVRSGDKGDWWITVRMVVPAKMGNTLEQEVLMNYLNTQNSLTSN